MVCDTMLHLGEILGTATISKLNNSKYSLSIPESAQWLLENDDYGIKLPRRRISTSFFISSQENLKIDLGQEKAPTNNLCFVVKKNILSSIFPDSRKITSLCFEVRKCTRVRKLVKYTHIVDPSNVQYIELYRKEIFSFSQLVPIINSLHSQSIVLQVYDVLAEGLLYSLLPSQGEQLQLFEPEQLCFGDDLIE